MSPILVRPVREQLEHDRVIRLLQAKYKRKFEVAINPGNEQTAPVGPGPSPWYPDLVLFSSERSRKLAGVVEVETSESINHLEAMSQWRTFAGLKVAFHLYVPVSGVDSARRLCTELQISTTEIWSYNSIGDQIRFTPVQRAPQAGDGRAGRAVAETMTTRPREAAVAPRPRETAVAAKPPAPVKPAAPKPAAPPRAAAARTRTTRGAAKPAGRAAAPAKPRAAVAKAKGAPPRRAVAKAPARKAVSSAAKAQKRK